jgi:hypothetical protein
VLAGLGSQSMRVFLAQTAAGTPPQSYRTWRNYFSDLSNQRQVKSLISRVFDLFWGREVRYRENIPLAVMSLISLAVLFLFAISEMEMRATPRYHDVCGGSQQTAISPDGCFPHSG